MEHDPARAEDPRVGICIRTPRNAPRYQTPRLSDVLRLYVLTGGSHRIYCNGGILAADTASLGLYHIHRTIHSARHSRDLYPKNVPWSNHRLSRKVAQEGRVKGG